MVDGTEELVRELAARHGVALSRDDPILILHTLNAKLLNDTSRAQEAMLQSFKEELECLTHRWSNDSKAMADRVLSASISAGKDAMATRMQEAAQSLSADLRNEVDGSLAPLSATISASRGVAILNVVAAVITFCAAGLAFWALR